MTFSFSIRLSALAGEAAAGLMPHTPSATRWSSWHLLSFVTGNGEKQPIGNWEKTWKNPPNRGYSWLACYILLHSLKMYLKLSEIQELLAHGSHFYGKDWYPKENPMLHFHRSRHWFMYVTMRSYRLPMNPWCFLNSLVKLVGFKGLAGCAAFLWGNLLLIIPFQLLERCKRPNHPRNCSNTSLFLKFGDTQRILKPWLSILKWSNFRMFWGYPHFGSPPIECDTVEESCTSW